MDSNLNGFGVLRGSPMEQSRIGAWSDAMIVLRLRKEN